MKQTLILLVITAIIGGIFLVITQFSSPPNQQPNNGKRDIGGITPDPNSTTLIPTPPPPVVPSPHGPRILSSYSGSYALLIGESHYTNGWQNLESIPGELQQVETLLTSKGFHVEKALNLNTRQLKNTFETFINQYGFDKNNRLLFFYSGHGHTRAKKGYIVPIDAPNPDFNEKGFLQKAVTMNEILAWARRLEAKHALFLFDSCFSGTVFLAKQRPTVPPQISQAAARPVRQFITAGSANETVPAKSVFTPAFVDALGEGWGDMNNDGYVTGQELGLYLWNKVPQHSEQTPQYGRIKDYELAQGDFVFAVSGGTGTQRVDNDRDGVADPEDRCPNNTAAQLTHGVAKHGPQIGCPLDSDQDMVANYQDSCPYNRPAEIVQGVKPNGCPIDRDRDGVADYRDSCPHNQPPEIAQGVQSNGCPIDSDQDNVADYQDACLGTALGAKVNHEGCPLLISLASMPPKTVFRDTLRDGGKGTEMVVIPAGRFQMGDLQGGGSSNEKPVHWVSVEKFAIGRYEITNAEFVRFLNAVKLRGTKKQPWFATKAESSYSQITGSVGHFRAESGYENHPVVTVSWYGATAYAQWLSQQTGKQYRLPTEAQWEYAARAGTTTKYWWGNQIGSNKANCDNDCGDRFDYTAPVGSFAPNPFGLYDTTGNVWEWTCSEYEDKYTGREQRCAKSADRFAVRGGSVGAVGEPLPSHAG